MPNFKPKDIIAGLTLILLTVIKLAGKDGIIDIGFGLILGYYFAHRQDGTDNGV